MIQIIIENINDIDVYLEELRSIKIWVCNTACGKSYLCSIDDRFIDLDWHRSQFMEKGVPDYDEKTISLMEEFLANGKIILNASHHHFLNYLDKNNIPFVYMYPKPELQDEYIERMRNRGSSEEFIKNFGTIIAPDFKNWHNDDLGTFKIEMNSGEFVSDYLWKVFGKK